MEYKDHKKRCSWVNTNNEEYIKYHDNQWGFPIYDDHSLFKALILELFQSGLSFECVFNKRHAFDIAFDNFDIDRIVQYSDDKIELIMQDKSIIRNKQKIIATVNNAKIFKAIQKEFGCFINYLHSFTGEDIIYETGLQTSPISDNISKDLKNRGMKFLGSKTIYAYLQAIGIIYSHEKNCFLFHK